ncbi:MAG: hypothetical protein Q8K59_07120 [Nitrosomonas sp.]|nr:hypothetical protein [Nitrosomonas sp.]MDP1950847.1 hypothetical protein [Nitrosomonas sp.]
MRTLFLLLAICLLTIPVTLLILAIEDEPLVVRQVSISPEYVERTKQIIDTHRSQKDNPEELTSARILSQDADIAANYLANRFGRGRAQVLMGDHRALVCLSLPMPANTVDGYLNLEVTLTETTGLPHPQSVRIGKLSIPDFLTNWLTTQFTQWLQLNPGIHASVDTIKLVQFSQDAISIIYRRKDNSSQPESSFPIISKKAQAQLFRYHTLLVENSQQSDASTASLAEILLPLMRLAAKHSVNGDALAENRAVILVTTFHALGMPLKLLVPEAVNWPRSINQIVTIDGRKDFSQHFMVSAAISAYADTTLSDAIGLYKEIDDLRYGSGFSFNDIAANRAGTRFGEKAVANQASAQKLQQLVISGLKDADLMPPWSDLPEHMSESEFHQRFGSINTPAYQQMTQEIEKRVSALRFLR